MITNFEKPEILSPAGDMDCLKSALNFGADAVFLAGKMFGMRSAVLIGTFLVDVTDSKCISDFLVSVSLNLESLFISGKSLFVLCNLGRSYKVKPCAVNISL